MYLHKHEIISLLNKTFDDYIGFVNTLPDHRFTASPYGKWSAGQQLDHLTKSVRPVSSALGFPKIMLRYFGWHNGASRTYDTLVAQYETILARGAKSTKAYLPGVVYGAQRPALVQSFLAQKVKLAAKVRHWSEKDLDRYRLPHPLMGKLTVREMLYFTAYHNQHHLEKLRDQELHAHTWENQLQQLIF
ncbi:DinB family protein [Chitinophaga vietnamensis]|uniref:DinB family protein n=1 Tax=Chitinophaga vietnamensis TaxID=2593957 RepID=UPI001177C550|nr:DinB family protein [Chitinophaga vietnamensis]